MFIDYPHKNKILKNKPNFIIKSLSDKKVLHKEFYVLNFLKKQLPVPKVYNLKNNSFREERLYGREITKADLTEKNIKKLALILKKLHALKIPTDIKRLIRNNFLKKNLYQPTLIVREIIKKLPIRFTAGLEKNIFSMARNFESELAKKKHKTSLIHGDLSYHNIFLQNNEIFLIDWSDCRFDISSCDVSQLFYLLKFNQKQKKIFLKYYQTDGVENSILKFHEMLLLLYNLVSNSIKRKTINRSKLTAFILFCKKFYD